MKAKGGALDAGDACEVALKVDDTVLSTIECLQLRHKVDMLTMCAITHAVINRSQEEKMDQEQGKHLLEWQQGWTWAHHTRLVEVKDELDRPRGYSVNSPLDLVRMLGNADRDFNSLFKGNTPLRALVDGFPPMYCMIASLIPFLNNDQLGVDEEQRESAQRHLEDNSNRRQLKRQLKR